jgi:hypothetical protein
MAPSKVDPSWKQARSSNDKEEENLFLLIEWQELFQVQGKLQFIWQKCHLKIYIMNVLMREMHSDVQFHL